MRVLLDSCILIDYLAGVAPARAYLTAVEGAAISLVTWMEVVAGVASPEEDAVVRAFLAGFVRLPIEASIAEEAVSIRRARRLKLPDAVIAATARVHGRTLATRNTKDFHPGDAGIVIPYIL